VFITPINQHITSFIPLLLLRYILLPRRLHLPMAFQLKQ